MFTDEQRTEGTSPEKRHGNKEGGNRFIRLIAAIHRRRVILHQGRPQYHIEDVALVRDRYGWDHWVKLF